MVNLFYIAAHFRVYIFAKEGYTAISRKVVGKMCTRQSQKVIWDMSNTLFLRTVPAKPTFVAFL